MHDQGDPAHDAIHFFPDGKYSQARGELFQFWSVVNKRWKAHGALEQLIIQIGRASFVPSAPLKEVE